MVLPQHNGSVYQHKSKDHFKETWLCLEPNGTLTWKKKDAYQVKGESYMEEILDEITIDGWAKQKSEKNHAAPFIMKIPIVVRGSKTNHDFLLLHGADLDSWLDAFATVVGKWKLWKNIKERHANKISHEKSIDARSVERLLEYEDLVKFYKSTWQEFLDLYKKPGVEETFSNGQTQNGHIVLHFDDEESNTIASSSHHNRLPLVNPPVVNHQHHQQQQQPDPQQQQTVNVTVHPLQNGTSKYETQNGKVTNESKEIYGEEDDGEELHF